MPIVNFKAIAGVIDGSTSGSMARGTSSAFSSSSSQSYCSCPSWMKSETKFSRLRAYISLAWVAAAALVAFARLELGSRSPLVDLRLFADRAFAAANAVTVASGSLAPLAVVRER